MGGTFCGQGGAATPKPAGIDPGDGKRTANLHAFNAPAYIVADADLGNNLVASGEGQNVKVNWTGLRFHMARIQLITRVNSI